MNDTESTVIPVVEEGIVVRKRTVKTGGVRLTKVVHEREEVVDEPLQEQRVTVTRVPINDIVSQVPTVRHEGDTMIIPVVEEVLVVEKRLVLREEVRITTQRTTVHKPQTVTLRREEAVIERLPTPERKEL